MPEESGESASRQEFLQANGVRQYLRSDHTSSYPIHGSVGSSSYSFMIADRRTADSQKKCEDLWGGSISGRSVLESVCFDCMRTREREDQMQGKKLTVLALIKAKKGMEDMVRQELLSLVDPTRREPGCISYDLHQAPDDKSFFVFYENWKSRENLDRHLEMPYLKAFREKDVHILAKPVEITLLEMIG